MDKNKNRTDLLAAGRKKLQQYRQKKDGSSDTSSSRGKSSKKSNKSRQHEHDPDKHKHAVSEKEDDSHVDSTHQNVDTSTSQLIETVAENPEVPVQEQETVVDNRDHELQADPSVPTEGENNNLVVVAEEAMTDNLRTSNVLDSEEKAKTEVVVQPETPFIHADVGCALLLLRTMQDASDLGLKQFDSTGETESDGIPKHTSSEHGQSEAAEIEPSRSSGLNHQLVDEMSVLRVTLNEALEKNESLAVELASCKDLLGALQTEKDNLTGIVTSLTEENKKLDEEKQSLAQENEKIATESTDCKHFASSLEEDIANLQGSLALLMEEKMNLEKDKVNFVSENERLSSELHLLQEQLSSHVPKSPHLNEGSVSGGIYASVPDTTLSYAGSRSLLIELSKQENFDDSFGFVAMKRHLEETDKILQELEHAIECMHSHTSSTKSTTKTSAPAVSKPAVSKLIQAFESKGHEDEDEEERSKTEDKSRTDAFMLTKEQTGNLRDVLKLLMVDAENASVLLKNEEDGRKSAEVTYVDLKMQNEGLKEHTDNLQLTNIELGVLYEAVKQHLLDVEARSNELEILCEKLKQQEISVQLENHELGERLNESQSKISELQTQLHDLQSNSDEVASGLQNQLENLQKEAAERAITMQAEWSSTIGQFVETIGRLEESIAKLSVSNVSPDNNLDAHSRIAFSVDAAINVMEDLQGKAESAYTDLGRASNSYQELKDKFDELHGKDESAIETLHNLYGDLRKLLINFRGPLGEYDEKLQDPVAYSQYETLIKQLEHFLGERLHLESENSRLNSELATKIKDIEEMNLAVQKLIEDVEAVVKQDHDSVNLPTYSRLESAVALLVQKLKEASEHVSSSREGFEANQMDLTELQNKILELTGLNLQHETEILALRENAHRAEESLTTKASELEQSEQRVNSLREKLGIAVSKGKGLIVQRDSFKQSLAETSSELERVSHELQLKDSWLQELEAKLKTYSEAGERVEALESELSYIRNTATALRESFLLKDSALQRIEEILEDLDLPDEFHEGDIIEKIDWLARSAVGNNSVPATDADQQNSVGGEHFDSGFLVMDKEDGQESSSSGDDLRKKYEELKSRFYGLAEQNDMLEQSLMERNLMVQRWEELLDQISMPPFLRSMEPEGRIEWLGIALSEAINDRESLQQKVDDLENSCELLSVDFEMSQKRISTLQADLQAVIHEREHLSENLEILGGDCEKLSVLIVQLELEKEQLRYESNGLQGISVQNLENVEHIQTIEVDEHHSEKADVSVDESSREITVDEETQLATMMKEKENALRDLEIVKEERDSFMEKQKYLVSEIEALDTRNEKLQVLLNHEEQTSASLGEKLNVSMEKQQSLVSELEELDKRNAELQELLNHEEQKSASLGEKLNVYVEKQQSLVSELEELNKRNAELQELLNDEEQKSASLGEKLNVYVEKQQSLVSELEALDKRNAELQELLNHEEQKSASLGEKLNVYVEKQQSLVSELEALDKRNEELQELLNQEDQKFSSLIEKFNVESDSYVEKQQSLVSEVEALQKRNEELQKLMNQGEEKSASLRENFNVERDSYIEKQQSLISEVEALDKRNEELQELLNQEEHKFASLREKFNVERDSNVEKQQSLVSEIEALDKRNDELQELLNHEEQKSASLIEKLNVERDSGMEKHQSFVSEIEALNKRNLELQELLNHEEQKSASLIEKLNVESDSGMEKHQSFVSEIEALNKRNLELQELLNQEEKKFTSLGEKVNVERDSLMEKQQSLVSEIEALSKRNIELQELLNQEEQRTTSFGEKLNVERDTLMEKQQSLVSEIEALSKRNIELQELLNQEEQKTASFGEKSSLERDSLMEKQQSLVSEIESLSKRNIELQELLNKEEQKTTSFGEKMNVERDSLMEKQRSLVSEIEALSTRNIELQDLLNQEEKKTTSFGEKLNVERDSLMEKQQSLVSEIEALSKRNVELQELLNQEKQKTASFGENLNVERQSLMEKQQSLVSEIEALKRRNVEFQESLNQEEQRSASLREKLNVAVRKGKSLVQHRDSLKQTIEEMSTELERVKSELKQHESVHAEYEVKMRDLSTYSEVSQARESENSLLRNCLQDREHTLNMIFSALGKIDVDDTQINSTDPVVKIERIGIMLGDLQSTVAFSEQESKKSKRAAELLLAELNEVQERNDNLQEELAEATIKLEQLSLVDLQEKRKRYSELLALKLGAAEIWESFSDVNNILGNVFSKDLEYLYNLKSSLEFCLRRTGDVPFLSAFGGTVPSFSVNKENVLSMDSWSDSLLPKHFDESSMAEVSSNIRNYLQQVMTDLNSVKEQLQTHSVSVHQQASSLFEVMQIIHGEMSSQQELLETMQNEISHLQSSEKEKEEENSVLRRNIGILYEACSRSITEIDNKKIGEFDGARLSSEEFIKIVADRLLLAVKDFASVKAETLESNQQELKVTVANLQKELQEKDIQNHRVCEELVSRIKQVEVVSASYLRELESSQNQVEFLKEEWKTMEQKVKELNSVQDTVAQLQNKATSLTDVVAAKDQEIEALMQALDEEEAQMEDLRNKIEELEKAIRQKNTDYEKLEASRGKVAKKLSVTVSKFDELHDLSENLLAEVEKLQSQIQDRDSEISFLRQEVTRCTNDVLVASQMSNKKTSEEIHELLTWLDSNISRVEVDDKHVDDSRSGEEALEYKETIKKKIMSVLCELEDVRAVSQSSDTFLQVERSKVEELTQRAESLEKIIEEKQHQVGDSSQGNSGTSEIVEVEPVINKWSVPGTASQVRSLRKVNNDQVAIAIDADAEDSHRLDDEDDDKVHGFRSLTSSRIIPKFTRPVSDLVDGLWVSCDRTLQRQPTLRLGIMIYWAILHALLAAFVV
ncbi:hypothetical protein ACFE04_002600 [Oxalis oulophora]